MIFDAKEDLVSDAL